MNEFIKQNWFKSVILLIFILIVAVYFYWFQLRPSQIRVKCNDSAFVSSMESLDESSKTQSGRMDLKNQFYKDCLRYFGLEK